MFITAIFIEKLIINRHLFSSK